MRFGNNNHAIMKNRTFLPNRSLGYTCKLNFGRAKGRWKHLLRTIRSIMKRRGSHWKWDYHASLLPLLHWRIAAKFRHFSFTSPLILIRNIDMIIMWGEFRDHYLKNLGQRTVIKRLRCKNWKTTKILNFLHFNTLLIISNFSSPIDYLNKEIHYCEYLV